MTKTRWRPAGTVLGLVLFLASGFLTARGQEIWTGPKWTPSLSLEYFSRTIAWDDESRSSRLAPAFGLFGFAVEVFREFKITALLGYSLSNWNGLVFRDLPFSIDYEAGAIGGVIAGGAVDLIIPSFGYWEFGLNARFLASLGSTKTLPIEALNEPGSFDGQGTWMLLRAGPVVTYRGFEGFSPFLGLSYDRLWGTFTLDESIKDLSGTEAKKIKGKGFLALTGGTHWEPSPRFFVKLEGTVIPFSKLGGGLGFDFGAALRSGLSY